MQPPNSTLLRPTASPLRIYALAALTGSAIALLTLSSTAAQPCSILSLTRANPSTGDVTNRGYFVSTVGTEIRVYKDGHHFLSVLASGGIQALRPHPGIDIDGWGPTLYLQAFVSGAVISNATYPLVTAITNNGIPKVRVSTSGQVSRNTSETYGSWTSSVDFMYDPTNKSIIGTGTYIVSTSGILQNIGDLTFFKLADNSLLNVPLLDGTTGNTGDTVDFAEISGDALVPPNVTHQVYYANGSAYPQDWNASLILGTPGNMNVVDTVRQGYSAIKPAAKPSMRVTMQASDSQTRILAGVGYTLTQNPFYDNVGLVGYIKQTDKYGNIWNVTNYNFNVSIESAAIPADVYSTEATLVSTGSSVNYQGIYFSPDLKSPFTRIGSSKLNGSAFNGVFKVDSKLKTGYFRAKEEQ